jgi:EAL domain-containing protein (putative c-di-GMP-specific phosphodiesterase class I)
VRLGETLGLDTVAEGVEDDQQLASLRTLRTVSGQGFLFSRPIDAVDIPRLLAKRPVAAAPSLAPEVTPDESRPPRLRRRVA